MVLGTLRVYSLQRVREAERAGLQLPAPHSLFSRGCLCVGTPLGKTGPTAKRNLENRPEAAVWGLRSPPQVTFQVRPLAAPGLCRPGPGRELLPLTRLPLRGCCLLLRHPVSARERGVTAACVLVLGDVPAVPGLSAALQKAVSKQS